jgi:hypothetical protein
MRWIAKTEAPPKTGDTRMVLRFAWRRTRVGRYVVWLESYEVWERYFSLASGPGWWSEYDRAVRCYY